MLTIITILLSQHFQYIALYKYYLIILFYFVANILIIRDIHTLQAADLMQRLELTLRESIESDWQIWQMSRGVISSIHPYVYKQKISDFSMVLIVCEGYARDTSIHEIRSQYFQECFESIAYYCHNQRKPDLYSILLSEPTSYPPILDEMNCGTWSIEMNENQRREALTNINQTIKSIVNKIKSERGSSTVE